MATITHADDAAAFDAEVVQSPVPAVVCFWSAWCCPCRTVAAELEHLSDAHGDALKVVKVDVDANGQVAQRYGIQVVPTIALFRNGVVVATSVGVKLQRQIEVDLGLA